MIGENEGFVPDGDFADLEAAPLFLYQTASALGAIPGVEAAAWCGSAAMGMSDEHSDFDLYVYTNAPLPLEKRCAVVSERAAESHLRRAWGNKFAGFGGGDCGLA
jgi:hypothetical protein